MNNLKRTSLKAFLDGMTSFVAFPDWGRTPTTQERRARRRGIGRHFAKVGMRIRAACEREGMSLNG